MDGSGRDSDWSFGPGPRICWTREGSVRDRDVVEWLFRGGEVVRSGGTGDILTSFYRES